MPIPGMIAGGLDPFGQEINPVELKAKYAAQNANWQPITLSPEKEQQFQTWVRNLPFFKAFAEKYGEPPDLDTPNYDYRKAFMAGVEPSINQHDRTYHWASTTPTGEFLKSPLHPTAWMQDFMTKTGLDPQSDAAQAFGFFPRMGQRMLP